MHIVLQMDLFIELNVNRQLLRKNIFIYKELKIYKMIELLIIVLNYFFRTGGYHRAYFSCTGAHTCTGDGILISLFKLIYIFLFFYKRYCYGSQSWIS